MLIIITCREMNETNVSLCVCVCVFFCRCKLVRLSREETRSDAIVFERTVRFSFKARTDLKPLL